MSNDPHARPLSLAFCGLMDEPTDEQKEMAELRRRIDELGARFAELAAEVGRREEAAYREGLGDRAAVLDENRMLAAVVAGLVDRRHPMHLRVAQP